jgi:hypothetical protein
MIWKKQSCHNFKVLSWYSTEETEENHEELSEDSRSQGWNLNPGPPDYQAEVLNTQPRRSVGVACSYYWGGCRTIHKLSFAAWQQYTRWNIQTLMGGWHEVARKRRCVWSRGKRSDCGHSNGISDHVECREIRDYLSESYTQSKPSPPQLYYLDHNINIQYHDMFRL